MNKCSFCGRNEKDVNLLIAGISGHICDSCIEQAYSIVNEELKNKSSFSSSQLKVKKPQEIKDRLLDC